MEPLVVFEDVSDDPGANLIIALQRPPRPPCFVLAEGQAHPALDQLPRVKLTGGEPAGETEDSNVLEVSGPGGHDQFVADVTHSEGCGSHTDNLRPAFFVFVD